MVNRLTLVPGESRKFGPHFWEPMVDGQAPRAILASAIGSDSMDGAVGDNVPLFVHNWPVGMFDDARGLLGEAPAPLANGRVPIFICAACGDLSCGAITAAVEWNPDTVVWRDFGWDTAGGRDDDDPEDYLFVGPLVFSRLEYEAEVRRFIETFDQVRAAVPPRDEAAKTRREGTPAPRRHRWWWPFT
ncbi:hypothetical protein [Actinotalea subterranea]|uniref:hypothetical protein n=1 Tax=Actinotalea subterranea TaxID=2607497 RepID=UPI0011ECE11D|nr:hypothetical protein [Actinotalea subterranea]